MLFFGGHSHTSQQLQGYIQINEQERLSIEQLRYGLRKTISLGLKLAIFNSCDGLGLARELGDLQIPQVIVMREPVPNRVAQAFLRNFLTTFAAGASLFTAVREAREKLQSLESLFPCATWLPVLCHNPAEKSGRWQDWYELRSAHSSNSIPWRKSARQTALAVAIAGLTVTTRALGLWQPMELWTYDRFLNLRPAEKADERLLVVEITESDLKAQGPQRQGSLSDTAFEQALQELSSAAVIGADIYRDYASQPALVQQLATDDRLISLCKNRDVQFDPTGIAPPPEVPLSQVGFSDFVEDRDGILRRHLLLMTPDAASPCQTPYAFSTQIALRYLFSQDLAVEFTSSGNLQLGDRVLVRLPSNGGGYQGLAMAGNQLMLNYRQVPNPTAISDRVTLSQLLSGQVASSAPVTIWTGRIVRD
ncbi:MAG: CHASE2 domain-containing protein [Cyanobacteria bacterium P01_H01_bin.15]